MGTRLFAAGAAGWTIVFTVVYLAVVTGQEDGSPAYWYVALLGVAVVALGAVGAGRGPARPLLVTALVLLGVCTLLGLLSVGVLLVPAVLFTVIALARAPEGSPAISS